jgi:hypothetical protein
MILHIQALCALFAATAKDRDAFELVASIAADKNKWKRAHDTFGEIRRRSLRADAKGKEEEYEFLESCMKGVWNIGRFSAPFDPESSYKIAPRALKLAAVRGIPDEKIVAILRS